MMPISACAAASARLGLALLFASAAGSLPAFDAEPLETLPVVLGLESSASGEDRSGHVPITPGDVLTLRIGTWDLVEDEYRDWPGIGGDVAVQGDGTIMVPFAGTIPAADRLPAEIAADISAGLRAATGSQSPPAVVVEIAQRHPVYVSGDVMTPGAVEFQAGLTVRQAIALAGGPLRLLAGPGSDGLGRQTQIREAMLRTDLRIARLEAELAEADHFEIPSEIEEHAGLNSLVAVERRLMETRASALSAQTASVDELIAVLVRVKSGLEDQVGLVEADLQRSQENLDRKQELFDRGLTPAADVSNAEASLSALRLRLVDMNTQHLTVEKDLSEARRARDVLGQTRAIEILQELGAVRDRRRDLEVEAALFATNLGATGPGQPRIKVSLIPMGELTQTPVEPETQLRPGDTLVLEAEFE